MRNNYLLLKYLAIYSTLVSIAATVNLPGRTNPDGISMFWEGVNLPMLSTWHSPFAIFTLSLFRPIFGAPTSGLLIQSALLMLWPSIVFLLISESKNNPLLKLLYTAIWAPICFTFVALAGQVNKDLLLVSLMSTLFFALSWWAAFLPTRPHRQAHYPEIGTSRIIIITALLSAISLIRTSNILAITPCLAICAYYSTQESGWLRPIYRLFAILAVISFSTLFFPSFVGAKKAQPELAPIAFDLIGISAVTGKELFADTRTNGTPPSSEITTCYTPKQVDPFFWGKCKDYLPFLYSNSDALMRAWISGIFDNPTAYLRHRFGFATYVLSNEGAGNDMIVPPPPFDLAANAIPYTKSMPDEMTSDIQLWHPSIAYAPFGYVANVAFTSFLGSPVLWCVLLVGGAAISLAQTGTRKTALIPLTLTVAGLSNVFMILVLSGSDDLRYLLPTWMCALGMLVYFGWHTLKANNGAQSGDGVR